MQHIEQDDLPRTESLPLREPRSESVAVRVSAHELSRLKEAAAREGQKLSEWMREQLLHSAKSRDEDILLTELTGIHMLLQSSLRPIHTMLGLSGAAFDARLLEIRDRKHVEAKALKHRSRELVPEVDSEKAAYVA